MIPQFPEFKKIELSDKEDVGKAFSSIDFVGQCLVDKKRTIAFKKAIQKIVNKDSVVLDLGTGSGVMAIFAASNKPISVSAVEFDPFIASVANNNFFVNGYKDNINLYIEDARSIVFSKKNIFNVVISEMLTTGIIDEYQIQAINNLYDQNILNKNTIFIPQKHNTFISVTNTDFSIFGLKMPMIFHLWKWHNWKSLCIKRISDEVLLNSLDFRSKIDENFSVVLKIKIKKSGIINSVYLNSKSVLLPDLLLDDTDALNAPVIIPIKEKKVKSGDLINLSIKYVFGGGYSNFKAEII